MIMVIDNALWFRPLAWVSVTDDDTGPAGKVKTFLANDVDFQLVPQEDRTDAFMIQIAQKLDRETQPSYDLKIISTDEGEPPLENTKTLKIVIKDVNDNAPTFYRADYETTIQENAHPGDLISTIKATDNDEELNGCFTYQLQNDFGGLFALKTFDNEECLVDQDSNTANITLAKSLDADFGRGQEFYKLNISATDKGTPPLSGFTIFTVKIGDVNDEAPVFSQSRYKFLVKETTVDRLVGQVTATDNDRDEQNSRIKYMWSDTGRGKGPFELDSGTGQIFRIDEKPMDAEQIHNKEWNFEIIAKDHGSPPKQSSAQVTIVLVDENDNAPVFLAPNQSDPNDVIFVPETGAEIGDEILGEIKAEDKDATAPNNEFFFQLGKSNFKSVIQREMSVYK